MNEDKFDTRCLFCGAEGEKAKRIFVRSEHRFGKSRAFWGVCSDCCPAIAKTMPEFAVFGKFGKEANNA